MLCVIRKLSFQFCFSYRSDGTKKDPLKINSMVSTFYIKYWYSVENFDISFFFSRPSDKLQNHFSFSSRTASYQSSSCFDKGFFFF